MTKLKTKNQSYPRLPHISLVPDFSNLPPEFSRLDFSFTNHSTSDSHERFLQDEVGLNILYITFQCL